MLGTKISQDKKSSYNLKFLKMYIKIIGPRAQVQRRQVGGSRNRWKNNKTKQKHIAFLLDEGPVTEQTVGYSQLIFYMIVLNQVKNKKLKKSAQDETCFVDYFCLKISLKNNSMCQAGPGKPSKVHHLEP